MRTIKPLKISWKYLGNESPRKKKESEEILRQVYDRIFRKVVILMQQDRGGRKNSKPFS